MVKKFGRFDSEAFYGALDGTRQIKSLTWKEVATQTGVSASTLTRMAQGKRPDVDGLAALASWSGLVVDDFVRTDHERSEPEPLALISAHLRSDKHLTAAAAEALDDVIKATYEVLRTQE